MRVENKIKCYCVCQRLYLTIKIYSKELNKSSFGSGLMKTNVVQIMTEFIQDELVITNHVGKMHIHNNIAKRAARRNDLNSTYVWNRHLGHIRKKA